MVQYRTALCDKPICVYKLLACYAPDDRPERLKTELRFGAWKPNDFSVLAALLISGRLRVLFPSGTTMRVCSETICQWIYADR